MAISNYPLFSVIGIEIEYMIVNLNTLDVAPITDTVLEHFAGQIINEIALDEEIAISNELVMHVLELKTNQPKLITSSLEEHFQKAINRINSFLKPQGYALLPGGAHPWMNPLSETKRWPYGNKLIYQTYDKIFNCQGHGWSNLQSMHLNFPFQDEKEFVSLHHIIRMLLPIIPALSASSPFLQTKKMPQLDARLEYYGKNQQTIPAISGNIIPEHITSFSEYHQKILAPMYQAIAPFDPNKLLQEEWLNSRGAIAKFERNAIEIRIIDSQECIAADITIAKVIFYILSYLQSQNSKPYLDDKELINLYKAAYTAGFKQLIDNKNYFKQLGIPYRKAIPLNMLWSQLIEIIAPNLSLKEQRILEFILSEGNLAERLIKEVGIKINKNSLYRSYQKLNQCLENNNLLGMT